MLNTDKSRTTKDDLTKLLELNMVPQRTRVVYWHTNDEGETYLMVYYKFNSNCLKVNKWNKNPLLLCSLLTAQPLYLEIISQIYISFS